MEKSDPKAECLYTKLMPYRMAKKNETPSDIQFILLVNHWINPWHALQDLEKVIPFKRRTALKDMIKADKV